MVFLSGMATSSVYRVKASVIVSAAGSQGSHQVHMYPHVSMGLCFPYLEGDLGFLGFGVPHLMTFFAVSHELANVLAHGWPEIFGLDSFVCS